MELRTAKDIGLLVRDRRLQLGLSQGALAKRLGASRLWLMQLEAGKPTAQLGMVLAALTDLDVSLDATMPPAPPRGKGKRGDEAADKTRR